MLKFTRRVFAASVAASLAMSCALPAFAQSPTLLRMNMVVSNQDKTYPLWQEFAKELEAASNGTLKVEIFPSEALGKTVDMIDTISRGAPVLQDSDPSHLSNYVPDFSTFMAPYLVKKPEDIEKLWNSDTVKDMEAKLSEKGLRVVTLVYFGTRHLLSNREVKARPDTAGMKIRNAPTKMWNEVSKTLGGNPTNTAWSEAYSALEQGVADGVEAPLSLLYSSKLYETRPNISLTGHVVATTSILMSQKVYDSLPDDAKKALDTVGRAESAKRIPKIQALETEFRKTLEDKGIRFNDVDKSSFFEAAAKVPDAFPEWTPGVYDKMNGIIK
ncbi:tripartite ATP-independent transporter DctP family solute receptor [Rhizobium sp. BIGb0125]|jgi:tripartite ATP-independent transporter DctP family solute receptor|uniref:TRAP transporter substrate-binding protein DctP n=1 Tax=Rhizobium sp. BIGb0125 TaxID=2940618 RepID=UPI0021689360|nr:TRAP transporter substrate-binding protein DctP [Rhizobium sp. BIGb0125]MCS4243327.1 tripartite ATP-independent transporter DctP family solute receptor [Rhizobium sp. BIGb0125]